MCPLIHGHQENKTRGSGNFDLGKVADCVVVDPCGASGFDATLRNAVRAEDTELAREQKLFALLMGMRESSIAEIYVRGSRVEADLVSR